MALRLLQAEARVEHGAFAVLAGLLQEARAEPKATSAAPLRMETEVEEELRDLEVRLLRERCTTTTTTPASDPRCRSSFCSSGASSRAGRTKRCSTRGEETSRQLRPGEP